MGNSNVRLSISSIVQAVVLFVLIAGGIVAGLYIAGQLGITGKVSAASFSVNDLRNLSRLQIGTQVPDLHLTDSNGDAVSTASVLKGRKTLLAFVSNGCDACAQFTSRYERPSALPDGNYQVVLVSMTPEYFFESSPLTTYRVPESVIEDYEVFGMPTLVGVDEHGVTRFVSTGYMPLIDADFLRASL